MTLLRCMSISAFALCLAPSVAAADLRVCNKTSSRVGVAIGYKADKDWTTEGWWTIGSESCETLLSGALSGRFYYMYAVDYDQGGEWSGRSAYLCTQDKEFTIEGADECVARGYQRTGFYEIDTGGQRSWTIELTEPTSRGVGGQ